MGFDRMVGDFGQTLEISTDLDVTAATEVILAVKKPDGTLAEWDCTPAVGLVTRVFEDGDLDQEGLYKVQIVCTFAAGQQTSEAVSFAVGPVLS